MSNILGIKQNNHTDCGYCKTKKEILKIPFAIFNEWLYIIRHFSSLEWGAVFDVADGVVTGYRIPEQEVTSVEVKFNEDLGGNGIIHSHHSMEVSPSHQDDKELRNQTTWSIILSFTDYYACKRVKLPCGDYGYIPVEIILIDVPELSLSKVKLNNRIQMYKDKDYFKFLKENGWLDNFDDEDNDYQFFKQNIF
jgi:hypothetical protein